MASISKVIGLTSCSLMLCLGLSNIGQAETTPPAAEDMQADQTDRREAGGEQQLTGKPDTDYAQGKMISGQVLRVEGDTWLVKEDNGKEVRLHIDQNTKQFRTGEDRDKVEGTYIDALVNDEDHVLSIRSPDRRNDRSYYPPDVDAGGPAR